MSGTEILLTNVDFCRGRSEQQLLCLVLLLGADALPTPQIDSRPDWDGQGVTLTKCLIHPVRHTEVMSKRAGAPSH